MVSFQMSKLSSEFSDVVLVLKCPADEILEGFCCKICMDDDDEDADDDDNEIMMGVVMMMMMIIMTRCNVGARVESR